MPLPDDAVTDTEAAAEFVDWYDKLPHHEKLAMGRRVQRGAHEWVSRLRRIVLSRRHYDRVHSNRNIGRPAKRKDDEKV